MIKKTNEPRNPFLPPQEWHIPFLSRVREVPMGTYHSKLISVQVPILVDVTEVPDL